MRPGSDRRFEGMHTVMTGAGVLTTGPAVELLGIWKRFPGVVANAGAHLRVERGSIHAVLGENGAGKSVMNFANQ